MTQTQRNSFIPFTIWIALLALVIKIPAGVIGGLLVDYFNLSNPMFSASMQEPVLTGTDIFTSVILAPILETVLGQFLPIELLRRVTRQPVILIGTSALFFMAMHYPVIEFFPSAFAVGIVFGYAWLHQRKISLRAAFWSVALSHALHNALVAAVSAFIHTS